MEICNMKNNKNINESNNSQKMSRRSFMKSAAAISATSVVTTGLPLLSGCEINYYDYIVVGAGPGGGPLAANLAKAGFKVALLEAGLDPLGNEANTIDPNTKTLYSVPAFLGATSEASQLSWDFYVKHYSDENQQQKDSKYVPGKGVLYPRGSCVGGSAAHNALVFVYPHDADFDHIKEITGDESWSSEKMREYFKRLERCEYCEPDEPGHGFDGYLPTSTFDKQVFDLFPELEDLAYSDSEKAELEINNPEVAKGKTGSFITPMHVSNNVRYTAREYLYQIKEQYPDNLFIITGALATKVITKNSHAIGVEYLDASNIYGAEKLFNESDNPDTKQIFAKREVILSGGAFNTPQLLKLSGIGPKEELEQHGISVVKDLPGVGKNLQDRYEVTVSVDLKENTGLLSQCTPFQNGDPCLNAYLTGDWNPATENPFYGPYASNAIFATRIEKSTLAKDIPDLFLIGLPIPFRGYFPGHSQQSSANTWTWLVLKAHNENNAGTIKLKSSDPRQPPEINFHYFDEGSDTDESDLDAVVEGIKMVRNSLQATQASQHVANEVLPGSQVQTDDELKTYVKNEAWGHHASCSAKIGSDDDKNAVLDSKFRVRGVNGLRVVDASVFPKIPGFFPVASIFMISEKASDVIIEDAHSNNAIINRTNEFI